jgi:transcriptional regulator with XRE-family HTH domain
MLENDQNEKRMPAASPSLVPHAAESLEEIGSTLRQRRRALKVNATAAAQSAGVSRVTLHRIEKGEPSVTAGAYAAAALTLGLRLQAAAPAPPAPFFAPPDPKRWIPVRVRLSDYPKLKELAWQIHGTEELSPREALDIYERNWRHVDPATLSPGEQDLVQALRAALGGTIAV